ncbi:MAG: bifunctional oligoribonuclease/PAP phosphatase NrnA [Planctomycetota bacterium]
MPEGDSSSVIDVLQEARRVVVTSHDRPDGDALGAALALSRILAARGTETHLAGCRPIPARYEFLLRGEVFVPLNPAWCERGAALVALDCGGSDRAERLEAWDRSIAPLLNIDHHHSNTRFGDVDWVEPETSSASEMVLRLAEEAGWEVPIEAGEALWVGIVTDTGRFSYENTSARTLRAAARLVALGVRPAPLADAVYRSRTLVEVRLVARAMQSLEMGWAGQVAWVTLQEKDFAEIGGGPEDASDLVNIPREIRGVRIGLFFYELPGRGETKVSIRAAAPFEATALAARFQGGGHRRAAGCAVAGPLEEAKAALFAALEEIWGGALQEDREGGSRA